MDIRSSSTTTYSEMLIDPNGFYNPECDLGFRLSREQLEEIHLTGARKRFNELRNNVLALSRIAEEQGINDIERIEDIVPLLFPHTAYKSYPISWLENAKFDLLTRWLEGFTSIDLSSLECSDIESIDGWIDYLDQNTELCMMHTFGTTGTISFLPYTKEEFALNTVQVWRGLEDWISEENSPDRLYDQYPVVIPSFRYGASASARAYDGAVKFLAGGEENALFLYPDERMSADILSLAGRLRAADNKGEQGMLNLSKRIQGLREEVIQREKERPAAMERFFDEVEKRFQGKDVYMFLMWPIAYEWAELGLERGIQNLFGKNTVFCSGGGTKGAKLPDDYREKIFKFLGVKSCFELYGMTEVLPGCIRCQEGHYHIPPIVVPFVLNPVTGEPYPRNGRITGRYAALNLASNTHWGGVITGDEVTMAGWDTPCECGRSGPYVESAIRRYSEMQGGDDKITCAGVPEAYDKAFHELINLA